MQMHRPCFDAMPFALTDVHSTEHHWDISNVARHQLYTTVLHDPLSTKKRNKQEHIMVFLVSLT